MKTALTFRQPAMRWMITGALAGLCLHGACWYFARVIAADPEAVGETQRQMGIALAWMVGALALWRISPPASRLHAVLSILVCALFVTCLGSVGALATWVAKGQINGELLSSFAVFGGLMVLGQLMLAIPSAVLLQAVALTREPVAAAEG